MTRYVAYQPERTFLPDFSSDLISTTTATKIVIESGYYKAVFIGSFTYDVDGNPSGTVDTFRISYLGNLIEKVTNINKDVGDMIAAIGTGDRDGFYAFLLDGDDVFIGNGEYDEFYGGTGNDILKGGAGYDYLYGEDGNDTIYGGADHDSLSGGKGSDTLYGNGGSDWLTGNNGNDALYGGGGRDTLEGGRGDDFLYGGAGNDYVVGGAGGMDLLAPAGDDTLTGGTGNDIFIFIAEGGGSHVITDFTDGEDILFLLNYGITSASEARSYASNVDGDTVFDFGGGHTITVENVDKSIFRVADFDFATLDEVIA